MAQIRRDREANDLLLVLRSGNPAPERFFLYLRPFFITGRMYADDPHTMEKALQGKHSTDIYSQEGKKIGFETQFFNVAASLGETPSSFEVNPEWETILAKGVE